MRVLTSEESRVWFEKVSLSMSDPTEGHLRFSTESKFGFRLSIPLETPSAVCLAGDLLRFEDETSFYGGFFWLTNWDIGTPLIERCGLKMIERMRSGFGATASIDNAPGHLFRTDEIVDLHAFITIPMIFQWDAYYVPNGSRYFAYIRSNSSLYIVTQDETLHNQLLLHLKGWNPSVELPKYLERVPQT